jgi:flagellar basal-body rod modification protein FlgD
MVSAVTTNTTNTTPTKSSASISSDFDTFLKLLTTQMTNQDPLNPVDSTQFATQLAQFSAVEQQTKTNSLLQTLSSQMSLMGMAQLAGWVGQEARSSAAIFADGSAVTLDVTAATGADRAVLVVKDAAGNTVSREELPSTGGQMNWTPLDATGGSLPQALYTLSVENYRGEEYLSTSEVQSYATIVEARQGNSGVTLVLQGGVEVTSDKITALRQPTG